MALFGKFMKMGDKLGTDYAQSGEGMYELLDDFYGGIMKSAGAPVYGEDNGYFRAIMGKEIMAAMFSSDNIWSIIGSIPYNHEGVRIALQLATYGKDPQTGKFVGAGAGTTQDGAIAAPVKMPVYTFREPSKDITFAFDYGLTLMAFENKDDVSAYKDYVDKMTINFSNLLDQTILRPINIDQPTAVSEDDGVSMVETSLNSIWRCIASYKDMDPNGSTKATANQICPYGGTNGDFFKRADLDASGKPKIPNMSSQVRDLKGGVLNLDDFRKLYRDTMVYWPDSGAPNNKVWIMSNIAFDKLSALHIANNFLVDSVFVQKDFNGVKTAPGREGGLQLNTFMNIPIIFDGNMNFDFDTCQVSAVKYGDIGLLDLNHISNRILTPLAMYNVDNPLLNFKLQERNLMHMRCETYIDNFINHGRITGIADDA